ncbi:hypothetical protein B0H17DRAFT_1151880 [Mycena rosella]|uniref:Uncharacterized protein n=1 Tax=Mycena rosella TaxID=1033263 RepID=A0AAD7BH54_MYCRO|nr:hypothetical protein B0H17DRAFT_1151880 [Mycena rosella]
MDSSGKVFDPQQLYDDVSYAASPAPSPQHGDSRTLNNPRNRLNAAMNDPSSPLSPNRQHSDKGDAKSINSSTAVGSFQNDVPHWSPNILRLLPTGIFAAFLLLLIIGLELFNRHSPYNAPSTGLRIVWTYVPVGLILVVEWIVSAYDLQVKILIPWAAMSRGPTPAKQGWLLDYIGVNQLVSVLTAFKYRHTVVLLTTLGLWSTALASIAATSLFNIQDSVQTSGAHLTLATALDRSLLTDFDPAILADKGYLNSFLGRQLFNLSRPQWTTSEDIVLEAFGSSGSVADSLVAQTHGYSASLKCTPAPAAYGGNVSIPPNPIPNAVALFINVDAAGCRVKYLVGDTNHLAQCPNDGGDTCYLDRVFNHTCPGSSVYTTVVALIHTQNFAMISISAVECSPSYSQYLADVSLSPSSLGPVNASIVSASIDSAMMDGWGGMLQWFNSTNGKLRQGGASLIMQEDPFFAWSLFQDSAVCDCDPWLFLLAHARNSSIVELTDTATLLNASENTFPGVFSDAAQALFMGTPATSTAPLLGVMETRGRQLVARPTSIRVAQGALSLLMALVIAVYVLRPQTILTIDPSSIAAQASFMRSNHDEISTIIKDTITVTTSETEILLNDWSFSIKNQKGIHIKAQRMGKNSQNAPKFVKAPVWRPPILHPVFKTALCLMLIGTIIGLEMGLRKSQRNKGFADFTPSSEASWTYVAPAYLFVLGIFLSSYTFSVRTLEPLFAMHRSPQPARKSVRYSPAAQTNMGLGLYAVRYRSHVGIACAMIMLTVPLLKIVVSGLITTASEPAQNTAQLSATTTFNSTPLDSPVGTADPTARILALSQIGQYHMALPAWMTPAGSIAQLDSVRLSQLVQFPNTTITLPLEVMRGELGNCSALDVDPQDTFTLLQTQCWGQSIPLSLPTSPGWFGSLRSAATNSCGTYGLIYGRTQPANASIVRDITVIECLTYNLSIATQNVTLSYEGDTPKILSVETSAPRTIVNPITFPTDPPPAAVDLSGIPPPPNFETNSSHAFDTLFQIMTLKDLSTPLTTFLDPAELTTAVQALFATYGAIFASLHQRIPIPEASQHVMEVAVNYRQTRIVQAAAPTRIMQALVACTLALGLVTVLAVRKTNNVLTKPPYSIGATMGLLADSAFVELPE